MAARCSDGSNLVIEARICSVIQLGLKVFPTSDTFIRTSRGENPSDVNKFFLTRNRFWMLVHHLNDLIEFFLCQNFAAGRTSFYSLTGWQSESLSRQERIQWIYSCATIRVHRINILPPWNQILSTKQHVYQRSGHSLKPACNYWSANLKYSINAYVYINSYI